MDELIVLVETDPEGGYTARALGYALSTQGETEDELKRNLREAVECHFEGKKPKIIRLHFVRDEILTYA